MFRRGVLLAGLGVAAVCVPGAAAAAPSSPAARRETQAPATSGVAYLGKSHGYEVAVESLGHDVAILFVSRFEDGSGTGEDLTSTSYAVRSRSSLADGDFRARFGSVGTVDLRFRPDRRKTRVGHRSKHCRGRRPQTEFGTYRGSVSLQGEGGYFRINARRAVGSRGRSFRLSCARGTASEEPSKKLYEYVAPNESFIVSSAGGSIADLLAVSRRGGRFVYLRAAHMESTEPGAEVQAGALETQPGMAIGHNARASGGQGTLLTSLPGFHPATATLTPPFPFHGEGSFVENSSSSHSWTGTLGVEFPGLDLPLTGPTYATSLCVISPFKARRPCDFRKIPRVPE